MNTNPNPNPNPNELIEVVKQWVQTDNKLIQLNKMMRELRQEKKRWNDVMIRTMKQNEIDIFDIKDGQIKYKMEKKKEPLTQKKLLSILEKHPQLGKEQVQVLNDFVYENRAETVKESIVRKIHKEKGP
jgi:septum formation topological specificity factor MinE